MQISSFWLMPSIVTFATPLRKAILQLQVPPQPSLSSTTPLTLAGPTLLTPALFPSSLRYQIQEWKPRAGPTVPHPFPSGSKGQPPFGPCCIGCEKRGHTLHKHRVEYGPLTWAVTRYKVGS
ncbi:hypothetical protein FB446DRAFT_795451 [Lentinula raphanica]|nr:hypothetical protein FB446DRAFT_795451 [Lentinula raphanica]